MLTIVLLLIEMCAEKTFMPNLNSDMTNNMIPILLATVPLLDRHLAAKMVSFRRYSLCNILGHFNKSSEVFLFEDLSRGTFLYCRSCFLLFQYLPASYAAVWFGRWKFSSSAMLSRYVCTRHDCMPLTRHFGSLVPRLFFAAHKTNF